MAYNSPALEGTIINSSFQNINNILHFAHQSFVQAESSEKMAKPQDIKFLLFQQFLIKVVKEYVINVMIQLNGKFLELL